MLRIGLCLLLVLLSREILAQVPVGWTGLHRLEITTWHPVDSNGKGRAEFLLIPDPGTTMEGFQGFCGIEEHGNSTQLAPKKSYDMEIRTSVSEEKKKSLLGMAAGDDFVLLACYYDRSFLRNVLAFELWKKLGHYAPDYRFCELYLNGVYQGLYLLTERIKVDPGRVELGMVANSPQLNEGSSPPFLLRFDWPDEKSGSLGKSLSGEYLHYRLEYPKPKKARSLSHLFQNFLNEVDQRFHVAVKDGSTAYEALIDLPSFADFFLVNELAKNPDGLKSSAFFYRNASMSPTGRQSMMAGPVWDFDLAFDNVAYAEHNKADGWAFEQVGPMSNARMLPVWWHVLRCNPSFNTQCQTRLADLEQQWNVEERVEFLRSTFFLLSGAIARDAALWDATRENFTNDLGPVQRTASEDLERVLSFVQHRLDWLRPAFDAADCFSPFAAQRAARSTLDVKAAMGQARIALWSDSILLEREHFFVYSVLNRKGQRMIENLEWKTKEGWLALNTSEWPPGEYFLEVLLDGEKNALPQDLLPVTSYAPWPPATAITSAPRPVLIQPSVSYVAAPRDPRAYTSAITPWDIYYANALTISMHNYVRIVVE